MANILRVGRRDGEPMDEDPILKRIPYYASRPDVNCFGSAIHG